MLSSRGMPYKSFRRTEITRLLRPPVTPSSHWLLVQYARVVKIYRYFRDIYFILVNYLHIIWRLGVCFGGRCTYYDDERPRGRFRRRWPVGSQINFGTWASLDASKRVSVDINNRVSIDTNRVPQGIDMNTFHIPTLSSKQSTLGQNYVDLSNLILASLEMRIVRDFLMVISTQNVRNVNYFFDGEIPPSERPKGDISGRFDPLAKTKQAAWQA